AGGACHAVVGCVARKVGRDHELVGSAAHVLLHGEPHACSDDNGMSLNFEGLRQELDESLGQCLGTRAAFDRRHEDGEFVTSEPADEIVVADDRANAVANLDEQRSEEHTSELQSRENLVCRLLLEKKK